MSAKTRESDHMVSVSLLSMSGESTALRSYPADATKVFDLAVSVREHTGIPVSAMKLLWEAELLTDLTKTLQEVFGTETEVELTVVRRQVSTEEQEELNRRLLRAVASGQQQQVTEMLKEGALPFAEPEAKEAVVPAEGTTEGKGEEVAEEKAATPTAPAAPMGCSGLSPLMLAVTAGDDELATALRAAGAPEPEMKPRTASMPEAFEEGDVVDVVRHLAAGADVDTQLRNGQGIRDTSWGYPLHACCAMNCFGTYELAQLLIRKKADMNKGDREGDSPLAHARYFHAKELKDLLEGQGAKVQGPFYRNFGTF